MKFLFKSLTYLIFFVLTLWIFLPKISIYNLLQSELSKQNMIISNENIDEKLFGLNIKNADIYFEGIKVSNIEDINFYSYFVFSKFEIQNINFLESLKKMVPSKIEKVEITYSVLNPLNIEINASSLYGNVDGYISLLENKLVLKLDENSKMKKEYPNLLRMMKLIDGRYVYEYSY